MDDDGNCNSCPEGSACESAGSTLRSLVIVPGFYRFSTDSVEVYECRYPVHCETDGIRNLTGLSLCRDGTGGPLCTVCLEGWYHSSLEAQCAPCNDATEDFFENQILQVFGCVAIPVAIALLFYKKERVELCLGEFLIHRLQNIALDLQCFWKTNSLQGKLKVLFVTYQVSCGPSHVALVTASNRCVHVVRSLVRPPGRSLRSHFQRALNACETSLCLSPTFSGSTASLSSVRTPSTIRIGKFF